MKNKNSALSTGLALFSMFFGSGNLVFPIVVGELSNGHFSLASLGILITGVLVPFLGVAAMLLYKGDTQSFFGRVGKPATFWFPLIALSLMGPFGVMARCITVAFGSFHQIMPDVSLPIFSLIFAALIFITTWSKSKIVPLLGSILTPILLLSLFAIAFFGIAKGGLPAVTVAEGSWDAFKNGFFQGYQTMDLLASFFFSTFVIKMLQDSQKDQSKDRTFPLFLKASCIAGGLLALIYCFLVLLGASYAPLLASVPPEEMLGAIAQQALGSFAAPIVCITVVLACLTTALVLADLFAEFLQSQVLKNKINASSSMLITLGIGFAVSTLEFSGIAKFLAPILETIYPSLILLTLVNIGHKVWQWNFVRLPIVAALLAKLIWF